MKTILYALAIGLLLWACGTKPKQYTSLAVAQVVADSLLERHRPLNPALYEVTKDSTDADTNDWRPKIGYELSPNWTAIEADSASPFYDEVRDPNTRWSIAVFTKSVLAMGNGRYLVEYLDWDQAGKHPLNDIALVETIPTLRIAALLRRERQDDYVWIVPKRQINDHEFVATIEKGYTFTRIDTLYHRMIIEGDSLIRGRQVTAADTL